MTAQTFNAAGFRVARQRPAFVKVDRTVARTRAGATFPVAFGFGPPGGSDLRNDSSAALDVQRAPETLVPPLRRKKVDHMEPHSGDPTFLPDPHTASVEPSTSDDLVGVLPPTQFGWLDQALRVSGVEPSTDSDSRAKRIELLWPAGRVWRDTRDVNATIARLAFDLGVPEEAHALSALSPPPEPPRASKLARERFFGACRQNGVDFTKGLECLARSNSSLVPFIALVLTVQGLIDTQRLVAVERLAELADRSLGTWRELSQEDVEGRQRAGAQGLSASNQGHGRVPFDVRSPMFWMAVNPTSIRESVREAIVGATDDDAARLARGLGVAAGRASVLNGYTAGTRTLLDRAPLLLDAVTELENRLDEAPHTGSALLRQAVVELWDRLTVNGPWSRLDLRPSRKAKQSATYELSQIRRRFIDASATEIDLAFGRHEQHLVQCCINVLISAGTIWDGIRPLVLLLRALPVPAVTGDLRYWSIRRTPKGDEPSREPLFQPVDESPDPPFPWSMIPSEMASLIHGEAGREENDDRELTRLRTEFAQFCIDRLKSETPGGPPREPDPIWREAYIEATRALRVNPRGRGHRTLHFASQTDPIPRVRALASTAHDELRGGPKLRGQSPRVAVFHAIWRLLRAHLLALGAPFDERAADATRDRMIRRTTEANDGGLGPEFIH